MRFTRIRRIKDNFTCFGCGSSGFYSYGYIRENIYCEDCQNRKTLIGKILEFLKRVGSK